MTHHIRYPEEVRSDTMTRITKLPKSKYYKEQNGCHNCVWQRENNDELFCDRDQDMPLSSGQDLMEWVDTHDVKPWGICIYHTLEG